MNKFEKPEDLSKIKEEIHKEGFEESAAVLIGKKEEMPELLEKLEKEGRAENLGSYIKMHKEIAVPKEERGEEVSSKIGGEKGFAWFNYKLNEKGEIRIFDNAMRYIDKNGNIAEVKIIPEKIASIKEIKKDEKEFYDINEYLRRINEELKELGFDLARPEFEQYPAYQAQKGATGELIKKLNMEILRYRNKLKEEFRKKKKKLVFNELFTVSGSRKYI